MPNKQAQSAVNFQSDAGNVDFEPSQGGVRERVGEAAQNVDWNKVGIGVGAAAAVAGAAYAAKRYIGRDSGNEGGGKS